MAEEVPDDQLTTASALVVILTTGVEFSAEPELEVGASLISVAWENTNPTFPSVNRQEEEL